MTTERDPHRQDRIMDAAENLTTVWRDLGPMGRRNVNERVGYDLYKALHVLAIEVEERVPLPADDAEYPIGAPEVVNGAPGVTGFAPPVEVVSDGTDPWTAQLTRREALKQARKAWPMIREDAAQQAAEIITIAQAFERYLTDGTVHPADEGRAPLESGGPIPGRRYPERMAPGSVEGVIEAAMNWVDHCHLNNPAGPENWRNWAGDEDVDLMQAVLHFRGLPPLERKKP